MIIITNGKIVTEDEIIVKHSLVIENDIIEAIVPNAEIDRYRKNSAEVIDAGGGYVTAGFIDIHSDYIEGIVSPRPMSMMDISIGIRESERILSSHGITTMFHSLSIYRQDMFGHKLVRSPENVDKLIRAIKETHNEKHLIRHRLHARFELDSVEQFPMIENHIEEDRVQLLSFMDHTPGQGQYRDIETYTKTMKGYQNLTDNEIGTIIAEKKEYSHISIDDMKGLAGLASKKGIAVASHDDDTCDKINFNKTINTTISEFPITLEVAKHAYESGMFTLAGAPNIMMGGSHSGNLNAKYAIDEGSISILCSDYYPASMLHSIFNLVQDFNYSLVDAIKLITLNPARAVNMDDEIGSIEAGKKADVNVIQMDDDYPMITECIVNGFIVSQYRYRIGGRADVNSHSVQ